MHTHMQVYIDNNPNKQLEYGQHVAHKGVRVYQLQDAVTYTFKVSAINQAGEGSTSQEVSYTHRGETTGLQSQTPKYGSSC